MQQHGRLTTTLAALALGLALAACGGGGKKSDDTTTATVEAKTEVVLELGEMVVFEGDTAIAKVHADGKTEFYEADKWKTGPTLKQDGTVEMEGTALAKVGADGTVMDLKTSSKLPFLVTADKLTINDGGKEMSIELAANGSIAVIGEDGPKNPVRVEGAKTPGQRKTALAFLALMVGSRGKEAPPADPVSPTTPPG